MDHIVLVALAEYTNNLLWTGDKTLYDGLKAQGYDKIVNWEEVQQLIAEAG